MMTPEQAVFASILLCLAGAVLTLLAARNRTLAGWLAFLVTAATAALIFSAVATVLAGGASARSKEFCALPAIGFGLRLHVDGLTALFLMLAALIAVPASFYSIAYMRHYRDYGVARYYPYFLLFLAAMYGLLSTTDMMWFFLIFWQMMTLPGYALIRFEHKIPGNIRAANKYLLMMQIACAATLIGAEILADAGASANAGGGVKYDFDTVSAGLPVLLHTRPVLTALAFGLFLAGFGIKMGMWPFGQIWLPDAHPAAPSPVSAMLSGVMIKTGVYGLMRCFLWLVPAEAQAGFPLARWGLVVAVFGTISLFTGTMQALKQEQTKRLLAFHSIGQVGYILLGLGACMALLPAAGPEAAALAALGMTGALFHTLNHGVFKALLFLNAGSMLHATGTQDLNKMGGLLKYMPLTAATALVASLSISGVPLFNGFASKWSIYVAAVQGGGVAGYLPVCAAIAILTSALTLASFVKFFGASFLSRTSAMVKEKAAGRRRLEVGMTMQIPQLFLALICLLLGILPAIAYGLILRALAASPHGFGQALGGALPLPENLWAGLSGFESRSVFVPLALVAVLGLAFLVARFISKLGAAPRRAAVPWLCGYAREAECNRYVAHGFYGEIKRYFRWLGGAPVPPAAKPGDLKEH
ncbi:MAG: proton-conducting transporter membrane subunit [Verrucomicrobiota bacterium]|jgi:formate hydrogenlyase subunit 3/multisubunit Na+/H+ antiporter MnhD subunit